MKIIKILIFIVSIVISTIAAGFSVFGLAHLFSGAFLAVIVMGSVLEVAKIVTTVYLHANWEILPKLRKFLMSFMVVVLMGITSLGIYGFLQNAYQESYRVLQTKQLEIQLIQDNIANYQSKSLDLQDLISQNANRIASLNLVQQQQERRIDSLYAMKWYRTAQSESVRKQETTKELKNRFKIRDSLQNLISANNDMVFKLQSDIAQVELNSSNDDINTLVYLSKLTGFSMDLIANILTLVIIFVFDPLAILLMISFTDTLKSKPVEDPEDYWEVEFDLDTDEEVITPDEPIEPIKKPEPEINTRVVEPEEYTKKPDPPEQNEKKQKKSTRNVSSY